MRRSCIVLLVSLCVTAALQAEIIGVAGGIEAPPPTLGPYLMTEFPLDDRPLFETVTSIPSPLGGELDFAMPMMHFRVGEGWAYWGHGYERDVYDSLGYQEVMLSLPPDTMAFYLYGSHPNTTYHEITAVADDSAMITQLVHPFDGAKYFGFYQADPSGPPLEEIVVTTTAGWLALGEFGIAIPAPGMLAMLAIAGLSARLPRRRR